MVCNSPESLCHYDPRISRKDGCMERVTRTTDRKEVPAQYMCKPQFAVGGITLQGSDPFVAHVVSCAVRQPHQASLCPTGLNNNAEQLFFAWPQPAFMSSPQPHLVWALSAEV